MQTISKTSQPTKELIFYSVRTMLKNSSLVNFCFSFKFVAYFSSVCELSVNLIKKMEVRMLLI